MAPEPVRLSTMEGNGEEQDDNDVLAELFSDESSFYGDDEIKGIYEDNASAFSPAAFWKTDPFYLHHLAASNRERSDLVSHPAPSESNFKDSCSFSDLHTNGPSNKSSKLNGIPVQDRNPNRNDPHNVREGQFSAKQLNETPEQFVQRLPPKTTKVSDAGSPWLWVENPYQSRRKPRENLSAFKHEGGALLGAYMQRRIELERAGKAKATVTRMLKPDREQLERDLIAIAKEHNVRSGKWILRPLAEVANDMWYKIVKATCEGELGSSAKIATDSGDENIRLICVYSNNFEDIGDVRRILMKLIELKLVPTKDTAMGIFYKTDAWTHLDIMSRNEYGLKASLYWSQQILKEMNMDTEKGKRKR